MPTGIFLEYTDYIYVFSLDLAMKLSQYIGINKHTIKQVEGN